MNDMTQYSREEIESILQCSYYDRRTDYVWKHLIGESAELETAKYPIPSLESFQVMHQMLKMRKCQLSVILDEWRTTEHQGLLECRYNDRSGILRIKARSFNFTYRAKANEYHFVASSKVAKSIGLVKRETHKLYRRGGMFPLSYLVELDEQLYSRFAEREEVRKWRQTLQFDKDCEFCASMLPYIMQDAETKQKYLSYYQRLNIILSGNKEVRIGVIEDYSPKEMISMPCYPRADWQKGIDAAFDKVAKQYADELEVHTREMKLWSEEMPQIVLGKTPYSIEDNKGRFRTHHMANNYSNEMIDEALGIVEDRTNKVIKDMDRFLLTLVSHGKKPKDKKSGYYERDNFSLLVDQKNMSITLSLDEEMAAVLNWPQVHVIDIPHNINVHIESYVLDIFEANLQDCYQDSLLRQERINKPQYQLLVEELRYIISQTAPIMAYCGECQTIRNKYSIGLNVDENDIVQVSAHLSFGYESKSFSLDTYRDEFRIWWSQLLLTECKHAKQCALNPEGERPFEWLPF